jgi:AraC-like DNA-binding protein
MGMQVQPGVVGAALSGAVIDYVGFVQQEPEPVRFRELPCTYVPLILDFGDGWSVGDARRPERTPERFGSFVAGLTEGPVVVEHGGTARCIQVNLTPLGARRLLGLPMSEIVNRCVAIEEILGREGHLLLDRLAAAPSWDERFRIVDGVLTKRLTAARPVDPGTAWALGRIVASDGRVAIGGLARELGWSHRRLIARFRDDVGVAPKALARIVRFECLTNVLRAEPDIQWSWAAARCGFFDQAHLAREVRDLADLTPTALRGESVNFVQDAVAIRP